jgi:hypothetical protein
LRLSNHAGCTERGDCLRVKSERRQHRPRMLA